MTDNEIIKALKGSILNAKRIDCKAWSLEVYKLENALDLINRQKAEIERLKAANDEKFRQWDMLAEKAKQHYADLYNEAKDILKSEAYKECLAKVKNYIKTHCNPYGKPDFDYDTSIKILNFIDNLLKEMVGEE